MAFDFGLKRIGVAIGNLVLKIPHPLATITGSNKYVKLEQIGELIEKWRPQILVVGMPSKHLNTEQVDSYNMSLADLQKNQLVDSINNFKRMLLNKFKIEVIIIDESYSSVIAESQLYEQGIKANAHRNKLDQLAACNILQTYFTILSEKNDI